MKSTIYGRIGSGPGVLETLKRGLTIQIDSTDWRATVNGTRNCSASECDRHAEYRGMCNMHYRRWARRNPNDRRAAQPVAERFTARIDKSDPSGCWKWRGGLLKGYGYFRIGEKMLRAHRVAYEMAFGPIPEGLAVDHICHNRACVKPGHLRLATTKQNAENRAGAQVNNALGVRGVSVHKQTGRFRVDIQHNSERIYLGLFDTLEEAEQVAVAGRNRLFTHSAEETP